MNVVGDLSMQKHMEDKTFLFCHFFKKKSLCFIVYIVTLLLEFVPYCPMYLFHHVQCIGVSSDSMLLNPTKKKCMTSWQEKSLLVCLWSSLSASPLIFFLFPSSPPPPPHKFYHLCNEASPVLSFSFLSFCFVQLIDPLKPNKRKELAYFVL